MLQAGVTSYRQQGYTVPVQSMQPVPAHAYLLIPDMHANCWRMAHDTQT